MLLAQRNADGGQTLHRYDGFGRQVETRVQTGTTEAPDRWSVTLSEYDAADRLIRVTHPRTEIWNANTDWTIQTHWNIGFDVTTTSLIGQASTQEKYEYDTLGRRIRTILSATDELGRAVAVEAGRNGAPGALTATSSDTYDGAGNARG